jgi:hypothetical protein
MKQRWIAAAAQLPQSATEAGAQQKVTALTDLLGLEVKYLNTRDYPRLRFGSITPPATPTEPPGLCRRSVPDAGSTPRSSALLSASTPTNPASPYSRIHRSS